MGENRDHDLTFSDQSTHICAMKDKVEVAKVHNFVQRAFKHRQCKLVTCRLRIARTLPDIYF
jgi:hypothetical protein